MEHRSDVKRECKYPKCFYYKEGSKHYCCVACSCDHHDMKRLSRKKKKRYRESDNPVGFPEVKDY